MQNQAPPASDPDHPMSFAQIFAAELAQLRAGVRLPPAPDQHPPDPAADGRYAKQVQHAVDSAEQPLAALCLSGGGIRSAAFALGALQGLARYQALGMFHYLSTVSGGGYIGSWLTAWRHHAGDDEAVFAALNQLSAAGEDAVQIKGLRADSNYLTPRFGVLSPDTWAAVALVIRNLVLNWLVFGPFFLGALMVPLVARGWIAATQSAPGWGRWYLGFGLVLATAGATVSIIGRRRRRAGWLTTPHFVWGVLTPAIGASAGFTLAATAGAARTLPLFVGMGAAISLISWIAGRLLARVRAPEDGVRRASLDLLGWMIAGAGVGAILWLGFDRVAPPARWPPGVLAILGIQWGLLAIFSGELIYVGLTSFLPRSDMDREWMARAGGLLTAAALSWSIVAAAAIYGPWLLGWATNSAATAIPTLGLGTLSGAVTLIMGHGGATPPVDGKTPPPSLVHRLMPSAAGLMFAVFLAGLLATIDASLVAVLRAHTPAARAPVLTLSAAAAVLIGAALLVSVFVDINRFSLHGMYRNRLVRCFLGSARRPTDRQADPFTSFDENDDIHLATLRSSNPTRLMHVVNMALNVVGGKNLAWQERRAEPFTATRLACGSAEIGYRPAARYGGPDGLRLGTAMAISGAAVSPNMGYHSSPIVGFLLMLFNVRLGWWLGNPARDAYRQMGPRPGLVPELKELAGVTTDDRTWVYLSDGGHFENLGLYEMVRRRCRFIVISDAGADPQCAFEDLGNAVRKVFIDFGVSVEFSRLTMQARQTPPVPGLYCATGTITYPPLTDGTPAAQGWLLYVKPGYHGDERVDVRNYAIAHPNFPHESTLDQWFSESQFEAYRALGAHIMESICNGALLEPGMLPASPVSDLAALRARAERYIQARATRNTPTPEHPVSRTRIRRA